MNVLSERTAAAACGLFAATVYVLTVSPTIAEFDSSEFVIGAYTLGIVHAPGYPLYLLLTHALSRLPFSSPALAVNLFSVICAAGAVSVIVLIAYRLTQEVVISCIVALMMAFAYPMWSFAVVAEVYTLAALLAALLVYTCLLYYEDPTPERFLLVVFIFSLNLTNHLAVVMAGPAVALFLYLRGPAAIRRFSVWLKGAAVGILPLTLYLYLPVRWAAEPTFNYVGRYFSMPLNTPGGLLWMVSGRMFSHRMFDTPLALGLENLVLNMQLIGFSLLGIGLIAAVVGAFRLPPLLVFLLVGGAISMLLFFSFYNIIDASTMLLPVFVFLTPLCAAGFAALQEVVREAVGPQESSAVLYSVGGLLVAMLLILNWGDIDRSRDWNTYAYAHVVLRDVERDALIISQWETAAPLNYMHIVEGRRPDVTIFDRGGHALGLYDQLRREEGITDQQTLGEAALANLLVLIESELPHRPVYISDGDWLLDYLLYEQEGHVYRVYGVIDPQLSD